MRRWCQMMVREGGSRVGCFFTKEFHEQWRQIPMIIEEYPYVGMDYRGDPELLAKHGDQLVCMCDVFVFIFIHSVADLVDTYMIICIY